MREGQIQEQMREAIVLRITMEVAISQMHLNHQPYLNKIKQLLEERILGQPLNRVMESNYHQ